MRDIDNILFFRTDISPFLVHLTRARERAYPFEDEDEAKMPARDVLRHIIDERRLVWGDNPISDARFGMNTYRMGEPERSTFFGAVSFTETPLAEVHSLLEIAHRQVNLEPYGLVFLKEHLRTAGVNPVWYLNNEQADKDAVAQALCSLRTTHPDEAKEILPLIAVFGRRLTAPGARFQGGKEVDFTWEREWRWPASRGAFGFANEDVFVGLCPHSEIEQFEKIYKPIRFIDPRRTLKWYTSALLESRERVQLGYAVV
jgi:hypothetical protein